MQRTYFFIIALSVLLTSSSCLNNAPTEEKNKQNTPLFRLLPKDSTNISFNNEIIENDSFNMVDFFYVYNGGGVAIADINNDSLPDIFFTGNMTDDKLYLNEGALKFKDITASAGVQLPGWSTGVTTVDINNDGFLDIYVCRSGNYPKEQRKNLLYINQKNGTFKEEAEIFGIADTSYSTQAAFFDYDKDGDLDLYLLNHTNTVRDPNNVRAPISDGNGPANDRFYRNNGTGTSPMFTDITKEAGILYDGLGLGISISDINNDGWEDVFVTNDFLANDYIYINQKNGTFLEMSKSYLDHSSHFSMGNDMADFNNDGFVDLVVLDMLPPDNFHKKKMAGPLNYDLFEQTLKQGYYPQYMRNTLQLNNGNSNGANTFSEIGQLAGIAATDWSWSPLFADFDNDGKKDLYITNGYLRDVTDLDFINYSGTLSQTLAPDSLDLFIKEKARTMPSIAPANHMFKNNGDLTFEDTSHTWGLDQPSLSNGSAYGDLDNDGDLDIVVSTINSYPLVYENLTQQEGNHNYLSINLIGDAMNLGAIGSKVSTYANGETQTLWNNSTRGYQSAMEPKLHFGLGNTGEIDSLVVHWSSGETSALYNPEINTTLSIQKTNSLLRKPRAKDSEQVTLFKDNSNSVNFSYTHKELPYRDFDRQFLLPHKHSQQGPGIAVADVNGDGRDDFFVGGSYEKSGVLFYQTPTGTFIEKPLLTASEDIYAEDIGALFFDFDTDGDVDLYVTSGSNEFLENSLYYQDRLYKNDGKGNFTLTSGVLPKLTSSTSCVRASDFDQDGDLDLFIGGRLTPLKYPLAGNSYLLINENGKFKEATGSLAPGLKKTGMVTDALWTDWDNDLDTDLIVVGEFMAIQFFENQDGKFKNVSDTAAPPFTAGWWNSINGADLDNDGDIDYIVGNLGTNTKYKVSKDEPLTVYALDFDTNGNIDPLLSYFINGVEYPSNSRDDILKQIPMLKKQFPDYASFANATMNDLLPKNKRSSSFIAKAFEFRSSQLQNNGNGTFTLKPLPLVAQTAPIKGIITEDFDADGNIDLLLTGNDFGSEVGVGRYNALKGLYLEGDGNGNFNPINNSKTGLLVDGDTRAAAKIIIQGKPSYIFSRHLSTFKVYSQKETKKHIDVPKDIAKVIIQYSDGGTTIREFYYGASYLSQSTRKLTLSGKESQLHFFDFKGKETIIHPIEAK